MKFFVFIFFFSVFFFVSFCSIFIFYFGCTCMGCCVFVLCFRLRRRIIIIPSYALHMQFYALNMTSCELFTPALLLWPPPRHFDAFLLSVNLRIKLLLLLLLLLFIKIVQIYCCCLCYYSFCYCCYNFLFFLVIFFFVLLWNSIWSCQLSKVFNVKNEKCFWQSLWYSNKK